MSKISFESFGSGRAVILLHGFPLSKKIWVSFAENLAKDFSVTTLDLPGFGASSDLSENFQIEDAAKEIISFIKEKNFQQPVIVGHSLGGYVALAMLDIASELF